MSKYTYHIAFNVSDYTQVYPENSVKVTGAWENDSWISRVSVDEIKLVKTDNITVYDTLAANILDPSNYNTEYFFKIQKSGVDWLTFVFGVRWGTIDTETCVYKFKPQAYDSYYRYWVYAIQKQVEYVTPLTAKYGLGYTETDYDLYPALPYAETTNQDVLDIFDLYELVIEGMGTGLTVESTILNNDATTVLTVVETNGIVQDYISGTDNFFLRGAFRLSGLTKKTVQDVLDILEVFQMHAYFSDTTTIRIEHVYYLLKQLQDNAVSLTPEDDENVYEFISDSFPFLEKFNFDEDDTNTDTDFTAQDIVYGPGSKYNADSFKTFEYGYFTDGQKFVDDLAGYATTDALLSGHQQEILNFTNSGAGGTWTFLKNTFEYVVASGSTIERYMISNDIKTLQSESYTLTIDMTSTQTADIDFYIADRTDVTTPLSNVYTWVSGSVNQALLTMAAAGSSDTNDAVLVMNFLYNTITLSGWVTLAPTTPATYTKMRIAWDSLAKLNSPFSQSSVLENWWKVYRPTNTGTINGVAKTFTNSQFIIRRQLKKRYWPDDINMLYGINDGSHIAKIERYVRDLDSDFVEFTLIYQEYE